MKLSNLQLRKRRQARIRTKVSGTAVRPRLSVYRSIQSIYAQLIDDTTGIVLASASNLKSKNGNGIEAAKKVGAEIAKKAKAKKIETCVFDRSGYLYHGRVKALAEAAREGGLKF
ncbi:50S ribosomal protein L18 [Patescibacteria group bacterium]|nr:50S ribosomal protein L18 [Patescibacteria group bacterium]MBU1016442.1 50S ribosomal protein L18 [Patescibacteria group bacterium]MBU1684940.1 50S ribosomal protein L18 [Patescibacteria group bacterium]MBU1939032.1 50S ribosomal protein L18 [Patescibacteria group bacterium]